MKKLFVQSDSKQADIQASKAITAAMRNNEADEIVWYSEMGASVGNMVKSVSRIDELSDKLDGAIVMHNKLGAKHSTLKSSLESFKEEINKRVEAIEKRLDEINLLKITKKRA